MDIPGSWIHQLRFLIVALLGWTHTAVASASGATLVVSYTVMVSVATLSGSQTLPVSGGGSTFIPVGSTVLLIAQSGICIAGADNVCNGLWESTPAPGRARSTTPIQMSP